MHERSVMTGISVGLFLLFLSAITLSKEAAMPETKRWTQDSMMPIVWNKISFGPITQNEIRQHTDNYAWQVFRSSLMGLPLDYKFQKLYLWLEEHDRDRASQVQVTNYVNALKRGGLIK
jgi:hypothetical protein